MRNVKALVASGVVGLTMASLVAAPAFAWHPQGKITKTVQDTTSNSAVSNATDAGKALTVKPGDILTYTITVNNAAEDDNGQNDMVNTVMTDTLPDGVESVSNAAQRTITENIGTVKAGQNVTKQYQVKVTSNTDGAVITNKACFSGNSSANDNAQNGCATVVVKVSVPKTTPAPTPAPTTPSTPTTPATPSTPAPSTTTEALPSTGPSTALIFVAVVLAGAAYAYRMKRYDKQNSSL